MTDHFLVDLKYLDPQLHAAHGGASNRIILENYEFLLSVGADVLVRTPLIPGYTATEDNIRSIAHYVAATDPVAKYELLNFNPLCRSKYTALERPYPIMDTFLPTDKLDRFYDILREGGFLPPYCQIAMYSAWEQALDMLVPKPSFSSRCQHVHMFPSP